MEITSLSIFWATYGTVCFGLALFYAKSHFRVVPLYWALSSFGFYASLTAMGFYK